MKSLYNIQQDLIDLNNELIEAGGEITEETGNKLAILQEELEIKGANYGLVILDNSHTIDAIDAEIARLSEKKRVLNNVNERLKKAIDCAMKYFDIEKIETPIIKLSFRSSESIEITNQILVPEKFKTSAITISIDKKSIKDAFKAGEDVPGAKLVKNKNLKIK